MPRRQDAFTRIRLDHRTERRLRIAETLESLLAEGLSVILSRDTDGFYSGDVFGNGVRHRNATTLGLDALLLDLTGKPPMKTCGRCRRNKHRSAFGPDQDAADGHARDCRACEAARIKAFLRKKRALAKKG